MNKKIIISGIIALLVIITFGLWLKIGQKITAPKTETPLVAEQKETPPGPPVMYPDPPKLAGRVLVGPKVTTKFYLARDGKRYVFPDETKTFDTWYPNGTKIVKVSQDELETYPLGGNVCYRPGMRLIRIETDVRIFAVLHGCILRPITQETAGNNFGPDWQKLTDTLPDYYFTNYTVDDRPIASAADYNPANERGKSNTIEDDKGIQ